MDSPTLQEIDAVVEAVRQHSAVTPRVALVLGSGLGPLADTVDSPTQIAVSELPGWPASTVEGHVGRLLLGKLEGQSVCMLQGRVHHYEGYSMQRLALPIRVMRRLGAEVLIVTNAAGGLNPDFDVADLMMIGDHIFLPGMAGNSPLRGPNLDEFGPRFPDMSRAYDRELRDMAREVADEQSIALREGVYICLGGPSFETPAEQRLMKLLGADAVGMSTAYEVVVARHAGMRVLGFSGVTNVWSLDGSSKASHDEVLQAGKRIGPKLETIVRGVLRRL